MKIGVYARVSSHRQEAEETVDSQLTYARKWADLNQHEIADIYADEAVSGLVPMQDRLEGARLLQDAREKRFDIVAVYRLDRWGRNIRIVYEAIEKLDERKIGFLSMTEPFDSTTPFGKILIGFLALFAQFEREAITQRCQDGKKRAAEEGRWWGGRQWYGYLLDDKQVKIDEEVAQIVLSMFEQFAQGPISLQTLALNLTLKGVPPPSMQRGESRGRSMRWHKTTLRDILTNPVYKGEGNWGGVSQTVPAIVAAEMWERVQMRLKTNRSFLSRKEGNVYLLSGLLRCGICGRTCQGTTWKNGSRLPEGNHVYACRNKIEASTQRPPGQSRCQLPYINGVLDQQVLNDCRQMVDDPERLRTLLEEQQEGSEAVLQSVQKELHQLQSRRSDLREEKDRILKLYRKGRLTEEEWDQQEREVEEERGELSTRIGTVATRLAMLNQRDGQRERAEFLLAQLRSGGLNDQQLVRALVRAVVATVDASGDLQINAEYVYTEGSLT